MAPAESSGGPKADRFAFMEASCASIVFWEVVFTARETSLRFRRL